MVAGRLQPASWWDRSRDWPSGQDRSARTPRRV